MSIDIDWSDLQTFYFVAKSGSLSASRELGVNATTVRRRIASLELVMRAPLFLKNGRKTLLTREGERLFAIVSKMIEVGKEIDREHVDKDRDLHGIVRISTMDGFGASYLAPRLKQFLDLYPNIQVQLVTSPHVLSLSEREADVSLNMMSPSTGRLVVKKVSNFTVGLYGSQRYFKKYGTPTNLEALADHSFVTYVDELVSVPYVRWLSEVVPHARTPVVCTSLLAQMETAISGVGLAMLPKFMVNKSTGLVRVLETEISLLRDWWLVVHQDLQKVPRIRAFIDFISDTMERERSLLI